MGIFQAGRARATPLSAFLLAALTAVLPQTGLAQTTPTSAQLETFRNLPPEQQRALLEALGSQGRGAARRDPQLTTPETTTRPQDQARQQSNPISGSGPSDLSPPRLSAGSTLLIQVRLDEEVFPTASPRDATQKELLTGRRDRIGAGNPYRLDGEGRLSLPSLPPINLSGLTDAQAAQRLNYDPRLQGLYFAVTLLPVEPIGTEALKPFGYDLFDAVPTTYAPATDIPVPADYRVGPGDNITVELFGKKSDRYQLVVNRSGALTLPEFGPIQVVGLTFDQVRSEIDRRVSEQMIGVRASVTMGELRSIRIFVVGDVVRPGAYTVSSLSTITNALFTSGGVSKIGSLRNIELKRGGNTVTRLDLYDLLLQGDTSRDLPLRQGDAIFVPPIGSTAGIAGEVRRAAIYEFREGATVGQLLQLAGGLNAEADPARVRLERIGPGRERMVVDLNLASQADRARLLMAGDMIAVPKVFDDTRGVTLEGHVLRPGRYAWRENMRLSDLLGSLQVFKPNADQRYVVIRRESVPDRQVQVISADAALAFERRGTDDDPLLQSRDRVITFSRTSDRGAALADLLDELRLQSRDNAPLPIVSVAGRVRAPGDYPLEPGMTVDDLIRAGGGLDDAAYPTAAELTRYAVVGNESRKTDIVDLDLSGAVAGGARTDMPLRPYDVLVVKETPNWREQESITLTGEVRFPGAYPIRKGETLSSVIERAGGLTDTAFTAGSIFTREELKQQERQQLDKLANRLQSDLALLAVQTTQERGGNSAEALAAGQALLTQLRGTIPTGRLVIDLKSALARRSGENDIELRGGDRLMIPRLRQYVTVVGEVQNATSHVWRRGQSRDDYIQLSGGTTQRADEKRIYIVRADGSVITQAGPFWFRRGSGTRLALGDTIVVPIDAERMRALPLWTAVSSVVSNLAITAAALGSL